MAFDGTAARPLWGIGGGDQAREMSAAEVIRYHCHSQLALLRRAALNGDKPSLWADDGNRHEWIVALDAGKVDHHDLHAAIFNDWTYMGTIVRKQAGLDNGLRVMAGLEPIAALTAGGSWNGTAGSGIGAALTAPTTGSSGDTGYTAKTALRSLHPPHETAHNGETLTFAFMAMHIVNGVQKLTFRLEGGTSEDVTEWSYDSNRDIWAYHATASSSDNSAYDGVAELEVTATAATAGQGGVITGFEVNFDDGDTLPNDRRFASAADGSSSNDGRDNVGFGLSGAALTDNGDGTSNVESTGDFSGYTASANHTDFIALNNGSTWRLFEIDAKVDSDNITIKATTLDGLNDALWTSETVSSSTGPTALLGDAWRKGATAGGMYIYCDEGNNKWEESLGTGYPSASYDRWVTVTRYPGLDAGDAKITPMAVNNRPFSGTNTLTWRIRVLGMHLTTNGATLPVTNSWFLNNGGDTTDGPVLWFDTCTSDNCYTSAGGIRMHTGTYWNRIFYTDCDLSEMSQPFLGCATRTNNDDLVRNCTGDQIDADLCPGAGCVWKVTGSNLDKAQFDATNTDHVDGWQPRDNNVSDNIVYGLTLLDGITAQPFLSRNENVDNTVIAGCVMRGTDYPQQSQLLRGLKTGSGMVHNTHLGTGLALDLSDTGSVDGEWLADADCFRLMFNVLQWATCSNTQSITDGVDTFGATWEGFFDGIEYHTGTGEEPEVSYNHFVNQWPTYTGSGDGTQNEIGESISSNIPASRFTGNAVSAANNQDGGDVISSPTGTAVANYRPLSGITLVPSGDALIEYDVTAGASGSALANDGTDEIGALQALADPPSVTSLSPNSAARNQTGVDITVNVTDAVDGAAVTFSGTGITVNSTTFVNSTKLTANIDLAADATLSYRDVTVTNPDTQADTKSSGFRVLGAGGLPDSDAFPAAGSLMMQRVLPRKKKMGK